MRAKYSDFRRYQKRIRLRMSLFADLVGDSIKIYSIWWESIGLAVLGAWNRGYITPLVFIFEAICIYANSFYVGAWAKVAVRPIAVLLITMFPL